MTNLMNALALECDKKLIAAARNAPRAAGDIHPLIGDYMVKGVPFGIDKLGGMLPGPNRVHCFPKASHLLIELSTDQFNIIKLLRRVDTSLAGKSLASFYLKSQTDKAFRGENMSAHEDIKNALTELRGRVPVARFESVKSIFEKVIADQQLVSDFFDIAKEEAVAQR